MPALSSSKTRSGICFMSLSLRNDAVYIVLFKVLVKITAFYLFSSILGSSNILGRAYANFHPSADKSGSPPILCYVLYSDSPCRDKYIILFGDRVRLIT